MRPGLRVAVLTLMLAAGAMAAKRVEYVRPIQQTLPAAGVTQLVIQNLVGPITITNAPDDQIKIVILITGGGLDETFARALTQQLNFKIDQIGPQVRIVGQYPLDHFRDYGYPKMKSIAGIHGTDNNEYDNGTGNNERVHIRAVDSSKAVELWAEIRVTCPTHVGVVIRNIYGDVEVNGDGPQGQGTFDGFTDVGDFTMNNPRWKNIKVESDYGKVDFTQGFGAAEDIHVKTDVGGAYFELEPGATGKILASKDLGFLHNDFTEARFTKDPTTGQSEMILGDGSGTVVHVDMSVGSLHLRRLGDSPDE